MTMYVTLLPADGFSGHISNGFIKPPPGHRIANDLCHNRGSLYRLCQIGLAWFFGLQAGNPRGGQGECAGTDVTIRPELQGHGHKADYN